MLRPFCLHAASQITVYVRCSIRPLANAPLGQARAVFAPASRKTRKPGRPQAAGLLLEMSPCACVESRAEEFVRLAPQLSSGNAQKEIGKCATR
jgi:hypothetical protein